MIIQIIYELVSQSLERNKMTYQRKTFFDSVFTAQDIRDTICENMNYRSQFKELKKM